MQDMKDWIGKSEVVEEVVGPVPFSCFQAILSRSDVRLPVGTALTGLWHWLYFNPIYLQSDLDSDGHRKRGGFLPPIQLPRRMWAGSRIAYHSELEIGAKLTRTSVIDDVVEKVGRSGSLVFVKVRHEVSRSGERHSALTETQDIVYREPSNATAVPQPARTVPRTGQWKKTWVPDSALLFSYSALTFNRHRIHYDLPYATDVEGYDGLVVHGPLLASLLFESMRDALPGRHVTTFEFRAVKPAIAGMTLHACGSLIDNNAVRLWISGSEDEVFMEASALLT